ncbi:hypothetical protein LCGC14_1239120, partial [marine sediment metagenome]
VYDEVFPIDQAWEDHLNKGLKKLGDEKAVDGESRVATLSTSVKPTDTASKPPSCEHEWELRVPKGLTGTGHCMAFCKKCGHLRGSKPLSCEFRGRDLSILMKTSGGGDGYCPKCHGVIESKPPSKCIECELYGECDHQGAYKKDGKWCYENPSEQDLRPIIRSAQEANKILRDAGLGGFLSKDKTSNSEPSCSKCKYTCTCQDYIKQEPRIIKAKPNKLGIDTIIVNKSPLLDNEKVANPKREELLNAIRIGELGKWISEMEEKFNIEEFANKSNDRVYGVNLCLKYLKQFIKER